MRLILIKTAIEFLSLSLGERDLVRRRGNAVPQVLDELNTLGNRECIKIDLVCGVAHELSVPTSRSLGNCLMCIANVVAFERRSDASGASVAACCVRSKRLLDTHSAAFSYESIGRVSWHFG